MLNRINRLLHGAIDPDKVGRQQGRQPTLESLLPGDVVSLWEGGDAIVESVLQCSEELNERVTRWRWTLLDGNRVLETAPDGNVLYQRTTVLHQESAEFEALTADAAQEGALKTFEDRVREGRAARNPVLFDLAGQRYRIISTGAFRVEPAGPAVLPRVEVWRDVNLARPGDNVYFELEPSEGEDIVLGIWTTHVAILVGSALKAADVQAIYPGAVEGDRQA